MMISLDIQPQTMAELLELLGDIPANRVLLHPQPGTATENDLIHRVKGNNKKLVELVHGTLVEKAMGAWESSVGMVLGSYILLHVREHDLGIVLGADGMLRMSSGNVRLPDVSFIAWEDMPNEEAPEEAIWDVVPTLTVEVLSESNTRREIDEKLGEYFEKGGKLSWVVDPTDKTVRVYQSVQNFTLLNVGQTLTGEDVLPGFELELSRIFPANRRKPTN